MNDQDRIKQIIDRFPNSQLVITEQGGSLNITAPQANVFDVAEFLKNTLQYDYLQFLTCVDRSDKLELYYYLYSYTHKGTAVLKTDVPRLGGKVRSVVSLWRTADWHEREAYDLFGVVFEGHPNLKRILLESDFEGHPLLKDFTREGMTRLPKV
jgi:NADH-quinone oxidoreductase subunit C